MSSVKKKLETGTHVMSRGYDFGNNRGVIID